MKTEQQMAIRQLDEKINLFSSVANGSFLSTEDFVLSNTHISTDTFNLLLPISVHIQDQQKVEAAIEKMQQQQLTFSTWITQSLLHPNGSNTMQKYRLQEVERNTIMMREHTNDIDQRTSQSLTIKEVTDDQTFLDYQHLFIELFD
ncbi:hypothetical protein RE735_17805 [Bacillus aerius]|uniref:hypothetical protein n=1 Tax=Bacillus aerius TaxID=293388 RepID=UPI002814C81C|nr:hypothetical protein [Bacillus aerius]WMT28894.1 hypothetical protein RE735_17805 [Bacillus aerius]